jgi:hypothetical protein
MPFSVADTYKQDVLYVKAILRQPVAAEWNLLPVAWYKDSEDNLRDGWRGNNSENRNSGMPILSNDESNAPMPRGTWDHGKAWAAGQKGERGKHKNGSISKLSFFTFEIKIDQKFPFFRREIKS